MHAVLLARCLLLDEYRVFVRMALTLPVLDELVARRLGFQFAFPLEGWPDMRVYVLTVGGRVPALFSPYRLVTGGQLRTMLDRRNLVPLPWTDLTALVLQQAAERYRQPDASAFVRLFTTASDLGAPMRITLMDELAMLFDGLWISERCSICMEWGDLDGVRCGHRFHAVCIAMWLRKSRTCPLCRQVIRV